MKTVKCLMCEKEQDDRGEGSTCIKCGFSPIPSYSYDRSNVFHPSPLPKKQRDKIIAAEIDSERKERAKLKPKVKKTKRAKVKPPEATVAVSNDAPVAQSGRLTLM